MSENGGYAAYVMYTGIHLHFTTDSYDYVKYNGKTNIKKETFLNHKNKYQFYRISRKYSLEELKEFLVANFIFDNRRWIGDLLTEDADEIYRKWKKRKESLTYIIQDDIVRLLDKYETKELLRVVPGRHPKLLEEVMQHRVAIETMVVLNDLMNFLPTWKKKIDDDIIWPSWELRCRKYASFLNYDKQKIKTFILKQIEPVET
jgi:hypothetical protein